MQGYLFSQPSWQMKRNLNITKDYTFFVILNWGSTESLQKLKSHGSWLLTQEPWSKLMTTQWISAQDHLKKILVYIIFSLVYSWLFILFFFTDLKLYESEFVFKFLLVSICLGLGFSRDNYYSNSIIISSYVCFLYMLYMLHWILYNDNLL